MALAGEISRHEIGFERFPPAHTIFGRTARMQVIRERLDKACKTDVTILIEGAPGSGKEVLAEWVHRQSPRRQNAFVKVNCAAIPATLLESELYGYERGAFTGALNTKPGRVEQADGGTLLLDHIDALNADSQAKLLQMLQDGRFSRLGADEDRKVDARVICTCSSRLEEAVAVGRFRADLYYRIDVLRVNLPRLAERREDIPALVEYIGGKLSREFGKGAPALPLTLVHIFQRGEWKGNIRELENRIASYILIGVQETENLRTSRDLSPSKRNRLMEKGESLKQLTRRACRQLGREAVLHALQTHRWNRRKAAEQLQISYRSLLYKIQQENLIPRRSRPARNITE